jgi:hypothetical protein
VLSDRAKVEFPGRARLPLVLGTCTKRENARLVVADVRHIGTRLIGTNFFSENRFGRESAHWIKDVANSLARKLV